MQASQTDRPMGHPVANKSILFYTILGTFQDKKSWVVDPSSLSLILIHVVPLLSLLSIRYVFHPFALFELSGFVHSRSINSQFPSFCVQVSDMVTFFIIRQPYSDILVDACLEVFCAFFKIKNEGKELKIFF